MLVRRGAARGVRRIVFTSTTALYGAGGADLTAAGWYSEETKPQPRTIYHHTKLRAEEQLREPAEEHGLVVSALRMSRCFPEPAPAMAAYRLHRGIDARDVADAHARGLTISQAGFRCFVVSASTPFLPEDCADLVANPTAVLHQRAPALVEAFARRGWPLPTRIDRVYCSERITRELGWRPRYGYEEVLALLDQGSPEVMPA
jgi:UDP-glucose 4-epimerase